MIKLSRTENTLFWTCAVVFCVFLYFLYDDSLFFSQNVQNKNKDIGTFNISTNDVRRKSEESFLWAPASASDKIYLRDSIFTGDSSRAMLKFDDGSTIEVKENSMITLNMNQGQIQLDLRYGDLVTALKEKSQIEVTAGSQKFDLKQEKPGASKVQIQKSRTKRVNVKLLEGNAQFTNKKNNEKLSLVKEKQLVINTQDMAVATETIQIPKTKPTIRLVTEDKTPITLSRKGEPFPLIWDSTELKSFRLEVSSKSDFSKIEYSSITTTSPLTVNVELNRGWYFWRVIGIDDSNTTLLKSEVRRLFVTYVESPKITSPSANSDLTFEAVPPIDKFTTEIELAWTAQPIYVSYEWQISDTSHFDKTIASNIAQQSPIKSPGLTAGSYYARVRGLLAENKAGPWSEPHVWKIVVTEKKLSTVELITKNINFNPMQAKRNPSSIQNPILSWKKYVNAKTYLVEISKTRDFKEKSLIETNVTQWNWTKYNLGNYYFRISAKDANQTKTIPSEIGTIKVTLSEPEIKPISKILERTDKAGLAAPKKVIPLSWTQVPFANKYILELDKDSTFKKPVTREISSNKGEVELPEPGNYHVRVMAYDNSQPITGYSTPQGIIYEYRARLAAPGAEEPRDKVNIFLQKDIEPLIWLVWFNEPKAISYELEAAMDPKFKNIIVKGKTKESRFLIKNKIPMGSIYWRVRAISQNPEESSDWSVPRVFNLMSKTNENFFQ